MDLKSLCVLALIWCSLNAVTSNSKSPDKIVEGIGNIFTEFGFSPTCVSHSLAHCEKNLMYKELIDQIATIQDKVEGLNKQRPRNCVDILILGDSTSGLRKIYPYKCCKNWAVTVLCDQDTDGGGWTVIQHREDYPFRENFYRTWVEYKLGFGNLTGEFWLGLDKIHALVNDLLMELRVDLEDFEGQRGYAKYDFFHIADESDKYRLTIGNYSGNIGDGLHTNHNGQYFSTKDNDNDKYPESCAVRFKGAWWYNSCHSSNINGYQHKGNHSSYADGINWSSFRGNHYSLRKTTLRLRPAFGKYR